jgi:hypothetical protein
MTNFIEIKSIHGNTVLINVNQIEQISEGISADYNFIYLKIFVYSLHLGCCHLSL